MPGDRGGGASSDSDRPQSGCQGLQRILLLFSCGRFADTGRTMAANSRTASAALEGLCGPVLTALVVFSPMVVNSRPTRPATLGAPTTIVWKT